MGYCEPLALETEAPHMVSAPSPKKSLRLNPLLLPADDAANCAKDGEALVSARPLRLLRSNLSPDQSTQ